MCFGVGPGVDIGRGTRKIPDGGAVISLIRLRERGIDGIGALIDPERVGEGERDSGIRVNQRGLEAALSVFKV